MNRIIFTSPILSSLLAGALCYSGCASTPPQELHDARDAYRSASQGPAAQYNPAQLHTAEQALRLAEKTFEEEGASDPTRDRAYVAMRKAQLADTQARIDQTRQKLEQLQKSADQAQVAQLQQAQGQLQQTQSQLQEAERLRREAEAQAEKTRAELARLAEVKNEPRGMVITLSGSVLFATDKSELLPAAQRRLSEVARALKEGNPEAQIVVEGHTDSKGSADYNLELSARRAEAVRSYLVSEGVPEHRIRSQGLGFSRPISDNKTAEGRANNRRVEIVVQPQQNQPQQQPTQQPPGGASAPPPSSPTPDAAG